MITDTTLAERGAQLVRANGIDIAYTEAGDGPPLVLLHGGFVSTGPAWAESPVAYVRHMATLAKHFRVIAPDTRGSGATVHPGGTASYTLLADDVTALIDALGLDRPLLAGFSDGAAIATVLAIRQPRPSRRWPPAGYDIFVPGARSSRWAASCSVAAPRPPKAILMPPNDPWSRCRRWARCSH
jgi:pimeloyl-ACP methyl ester carboxylesterase